MKLIFTFLFLLLLTIQTDFGTFASSSESGKKSMRRLGKRESKDSGNSGKSGKANLEEQVNSPRFTILYKSKKLEKQEEASNSERMLPPKIKQEPQSSHPPTLNSFSENYIRYHKLPPPEPHEIDPNGTPTIAYLQKLGDKLVTEKPPGFENFREG